MRILLVTWMDSSALYGWNTVDDANAFEMSRAWIQSVGFLLKEDEDTITLVGSHNGVSNNVHSVLQIPKVAIVEHKELYA